jgi:hypothetical protein
MGFLVAVVTWTSEADPHVLARFRNFYGILRVQEQTDANGPKRMLTHGRGPEMDDSLFAFPITGHYRYPAE